MPYNVTRENKRPSRAIANFLSVYIKWFASNTMNFFPDLEHEAGPIENNLIKLSYILQTIHFPKIPLSEQCWTGRPPKSGRSILNAFIPKAFLGMVRLS